MQDELYIRVKQALTWLKRNKGILQKDIAKHLNNKELQLKIDGIKEDLTLIKTAVIK